MASIRKLEIRIDQTGNASKGIKSIAGSIGKIAGVGLAAGAAAAGGIALLAGGITKLGSQLSSLGADAEEMTAKFNVVFGEGAPEAAAELDKFGNVVGRNKYDLMEMASTLQDTLVPLGFARDEASGMSVALTKLAVDVGSFNNELAPDVMRDFQSAIVGNTETVRKYGIVINQSRIEAKAMEMGLLDNVVSQEAVRIATEKVSIAQERYTATVEKHGVDSTQARTKMLALEKVQYALDDAMSGTTEDITEQAKALAIQQIILEGTTDAQGDAAATAGSWTNQMLGLKDSIKEGATEMGLMLNESLLPLLAQFVPWVKELIPKAVEVFKDFAGNLSETVGPAMLMIKDAVTRIAEAFGMNTEEISSTDAVLAVFKTALDSVILVIQIGSIAMQALAVAIEAVRGAINWVVIAWDDMKRAAQDAINAIPPWLRPGSPTPFEMGLRGIGDALGEVNLGMMGAPTMAMAGAGGAVHWHGDFVYSPVVSLGDRQEAEEKIAPMILEVLRKGGLR